MKKSQKQALAVGAGVAALAAAAAGVYMMTGKNAKNRKKLAKWAGDMQKDVLKELKGVNSATQSAYNKAVDTVAKNYKTLRKVGASELVVAANELKKNWANIQKEMKQAQSTVKKLAPKKTVRRVAKRVTKPAKRRR